MIIHQLSIFLENKSSGKEKEIEELKVQLNSDEIEIDEKEKLYG